MDQDQWLSFEIKPEICKIVEILFWPVHVKEHVRIIGQYQKIRSRLRNFAWVNRFSNFKPQNFASVATVTWMVGYSNFWYQYERIYIVFHSMDSDFQISRLMASESGMNNFWRNSLERHQITESNWFNQSDFLSTHIKWLQNFSCVNFLNPPTQNFKIDLNQFA